MIRRASLLLVLLPLVTHVNPADADGLSGVTLARVKSATVFVDVKIGAGGQQSGTGFLFQRTRSEGLIVTNEHVVGSTQANVRVVFDSGTVAQRVVPAEVVVTDPSLDLAILKVKDRNLPKPIDTRKEPSIKELQDVFILGFPFGSQLAFGAKNPAITVGSAKITSVRKSRRGHLDVVQVEGEIHPGNSGGPVVDSAGRLVGVAVAKIEGTRIGFAIPYRHLERVQKGRLSTTTVDELEHLDGKVRLQITSRVVDPFDMIKQIRFLAVRKDKMPNYDPEALQPVDQPLRRGMESTILERRGSLAEGFLTLAPDSTEKVTYLTQLMFARSDGSRTYTNPVEIEMDMAWAKRDAPVEREERKDDWLGPKRKDSRGPASNGPVPRETGENLWGGHTEIVDATATALKLNAKDVVGLPVWSEDGVYCYLLDRGGVVRKVRLEDLVEERRLDFGEPGVDMALSAEGLLVLLPESQSMAVLDEDSLEPVARIDVGDARRVVSAPSLAIAIVGAQNNQLTLVDLESRHPIRRLYARDADTLCDDSFRKHADARTLEKYLCPAVTPDGEYVLFTSGGSLHRMRIDGQALRYEQAGPPIASNPHRIALSEDGQYVALVDQRGNHGLDGEQPQRARRAKLYVFRIDDLDEPLLTLQTDYDVKAMAFDKTRTLFHVQAQGAAWSSYQPDGTLLKQYNLPGKRPAGFELQPGGAFALLYGSSNLYRVALPEPGGADSETTLEPIVEQTPLRGIEETRIDVSVTHLDLPADRIVPNMLFNDEADALFVLQKDGVLRRIRVPEFVEERRLVINRECSWIDRSKLGLIVVVKDLQEVWIVDEETLEPLGRIAAPNIDRVVSSSELTYAVAPPKGRSAPRGAVIDLEQREVVSTFTARTLSETKISRTRRHVAAGGISEFFQPRFSRSGDTFLMISERTLHRLAFDKGTFQWLEAGAPTASFQGPVAVSSDDRYIAVCASWLKEVADHPGQFLGGLLVYDADDLSRPVVAVENDQYARVAAFDKVGRRFYTNGEKHHLVTSDLQGTVLKKYTFTPEGRDHPLQLLVHPDGLKLLVLTYKGLFWVELPSELAPDEIVLQPKRIDASLLGEFKEVDGARVAPFNLERRDYVDWVTSADGKTVYMLDREGVLREVSFPDAIERRRLELDKEVRSVAVSKAGLLLINTKLQELWILSPNTLQVTRRIPVAEINHVEAHPNSMIAFGQDGDRGHSQSVCVIDLEGGQVAYQAYGHRIPIPIDPRSKEHHHNGQLNYFHHVRPLADGKSFVSISRDAIHRLTYENNALRHVAMSPPVVREAHWLQLDRSAEHVAAIGSKGNRPLPDHPDIHEYGSFAYAVDGMTLPAFAVDAETYPGRWLFIGSADTLAILDREEGFVVYDRKADRRRPVPVIERKRINSVQQIVAPLDDKHFFLRTYDGIYAVELRD